LNKIELVKVNNFLSLPSFKILWIYWTFWSWAQKKFIVELIQFCSSSEVLLFQSSPIARPTLVVGKGHQLSAGPGFELQTRQEFYLAIEAVRQIYAILNGPTLAVVHKRRLQSYEQGEGVDLHLLWIAL